MSLVVRSAGDPLAVASAVRAAVLSVDAAQPLDHITTLDAFLADSLGPQRFRSTLLLVLAGLGLALAAIGIYGVTARAVQDRTRELGLRMALGAAPASVLLLVMSQAVRAVTIGVMAGGVLAVVAATGLVRALPDLARAEPWSTVPAVALLFAVAVIAAALPARRAISVDPTIALRAE